MPTRSASDGGGSSSLFRSVFARSPLVQTVSSDDTVPLTTPTDVISRGSSWESREDRLDIIHPPGASNQETNQPIFHRPRKRSYSHKERKRPSLSMPKFSLQLATDIRSASPTSPMTEAFDISSTSWEESCGRILHHGEVQISSYGWRKKYEYLVLTEKYLLRFKTAKKASEVFPWVLPAQAHMQRAESFVSISSLPEHDSVSGRDSPTDLSSGKFTAIGLQDIIATQHISDHRTKVGIEILRQSQSYRTTTSLSVFLDRIGGQPHWIESISAAARTLQTQKESGISFAVVQQIREIVGSDSIRALEDYTSRLFLVHRRQVQSGDHSITGLDEISKDYHALVYLLIGNHKVHLITIPKAQRSSRSFTENSKPVIASYGIVSLSCVSITDKDDSFELVFRISQRPAISLELASIHSHRLSQALHAQHGRILPHWRRNPYLFRVPIELQHQLTSTESTMNSTAQSFNTTLEAFCSAFGIESHRVHYNINLDSEDSPTINLLPPSDPPEPYTMLEVIAFMRAVRYNEYFGAISFAGISLDRLAEAYDHFGDEHIVIRPKMGGEPVVTFEEMKHSSILAQELTAIIMTSRKLRRLDISGTILMTPFPILEQKGEEKGCCIVETLYPLCIRQNTNVDWIILSGIHMSRYDFEYIIGMVDKKDCHLRALELSGCQMDADKLRLLLMKFPTQRNTLEVINISNNPGRLSPGVSFPLELRECQSMKKIDLSRLQFTPDPISLISFDVLSAWRLEDIRLTKTRINDETLKTLTYYLESHTSRPLKQLHLNQCQINETGISQLLHALNHNFSGNRSMHLDISENWIRSFSPITDAIAANITPTSLALRAAEFPDDETFSSFVNSIRVNTSLQYLDISETQLSFRVDPEMSSTLHTMFAQNTSLLELDISAENTRLESSTLGSGFFESLKGLSHNTSLKILRIRHQKLELQGANALTHVLETNNTLQEIHCEHTRIPLTGFTLLNIALESNKSLLFLSDMEDCKARAIRTLQARMMEEHNEPATSPTTAGGRGHHAFGMSMSLGKSKELVLGRLGKGSKSTVPGEILEMRGVLERKWEEQQQKLAKYLTRNRRIAAGEITAFDEDDGSPSLPTRLSEMNISNTLHSPPQTGLGAQQPDPSSSADAENDTIKS